ncbi:hypothetical protein [Streptosporangium roseum]|uniref:Uncharacterized protein n=1 Tax=Streptosporangium roseum (strain ATCC 12428 / DSM 43021 / JCM 3005 / KCTC 9067 / NCIMB 10171 / NRRL 2505 / NI 9100) TaxID=479432 RepID=D2BCH7_STRRD|nr:hypothetical protein [Streptosporangium roseum]ACZ90006.1 hypothetical protein Sros_7319 [Streptosporangium roseum DSM 43021]
MALQSLQISAITAMRARDVSRPAQEQQEAADRRPLRDETPRKEPVRKEPVRKEPVRKEPPRRR